MKWFKQSLIVLCIVLFDSCYDDLNRSKYLGSYNLGDSIYVERFDPIAKTVEPRVISYWLTDSSHFRIYLNTYSTGQGVSFQHKGDTILFHLTPSGHYLSKELQYIIILPIDSLRILSNYSLSKDRK